MNINVIEIELSSLCNAKCSACMRTILDKRGKYYYKGNLPLDDIMDWFEPLDISNTKIKMCGVLGDPMINPELYEIIFYFLYLIPLSSKIFFSSPFSYISFTISHPPTNSFLI